jgi:hypothetical protein
MDDVARGPKRPVNMTLSENLVIEARKLIPAHLKIDPCPVPMGD